MNIRKFNEKNWIKIIYIYIILKIVITYIWKSTQRFVLVLLPFYDTLVFYLSFIVTFQ